MVVKTIVMSRISSYFSQYDQDKSEATKIAEQEATRKSFLIHLYKLSNQGLGLESKDLKLLELVEALGDYINSDESADRVKGSLLFMLHIKANLINCEAVSYLADVISAVPPRVLSLQQS